MMLEAIRDAGEELKRVDHLVWVSLKYTRTVDVIRNTIARMIAAINFAFDALLIYAKEKKKISEIPKTPGLKVAALEKLHKNDPTLLEYVQFYVLLRRILKLPYTKKEEYRRHVTMTVVLDGEQVEANIDILKEHHEKTKAIVAYINELIK